MNKVLILLIAGVLLFAVACSGDNNANDPGSNEPVESKIVKDLNADTTGGKTWVFYSLHENKEINQDDSATTKWDIVFFKTDMICNKWCSWSR